MSGNTGPGATVRVDLQEEMAAVDRLPQYARDLIKSAPYNYAVTRMCDFIMQAQGVLSDREIAGRLAKKMVLDRQRGALRLYGPAHPQAGA